MMPPPAHIQGFEILERIGTGAESAIYRARELSSRRTVALKHVVVDNRENEKYLRHVRNEYNVLRSLQESANGTPPQGIVRVYDLIRTGFLRRHKEHLLVMQYIEGRDLKHEGRYPIGQMVHILIGVCDALAALHRRRLIHGDMKPENIVVDSTRQADAGGFRLQLQASARARRSIKGTREYMAPEQVDRGQLTEKTDIYNFGASMYFLFAGRHVPAFIPVAGDASHFIGSRSVDAPPLRTFNASIPSGARRNRAAMRPQGRTRPPLVHRGGSRGPGRSGQEVLRWLRRPDEPTRERASRENHAGRRRVPVAQARRQRRHGHRVPRQADQRGPHRRGEDPQAEPRARPQVPRALQGRSEGRRQAQPPEHRPGH